MSLVGGGPQVNKWPTPWYIWCYLPHLSPYEQNDACENITLPQTSFAGGNNGHRLEKVTCKQTFNQKMSGLLCTCC